MANAGAGDARAEFEAMVALGVQHVRLSAYYREPFALHRTIREAWVADSVGLTVLVDVQPTPWLYPDAPALSEWTAAWDSISRSLPPEAVVALGNEPNVDFWWPWGEAHLDMFWTEARTIAHAHGRMFAGPHLAGDWPGALLWLARFIARNPPPDVLTVHYYGADVLEWSSRIHFDGPVWLAEGNLFQAERAQQSAHLPRLFRAPYARVYLYDWNADPDYLLDRDTLRRMIR